MVSLVSGNILVILGMVHGIGFTTSQIKSTNILGCPAKIPSFVATRATPGSARSPRGGTNKTRTSDEFPKHLMGPVTQRGDFDPHDVRKNSASGARPYRSN